MNSTWPLPEHDPWSTPFAKVLLNQLDLFEGASVLDVAAGGGIPAFHIAEKVGPTGKVLAVDVNQHQVMRGRNIKGTQLPWLQFEVGDMRMLPPSLPQFDRISGNLSFMFFRPDRFNALHNLTAFLKPGGQIVLTFPCRGTFESLWNRIDKEMADRGLKKEQKALADYIEERPTPEQAKTWLEELGMEKVEVGVYPLEVHSGTGQDFLEHPLLRGGFLDDVYECFEDQSKANEFMTFISEDLPSFTPLLAQRCAMSGWKPGKIGRT
jgi:ubiquinone/menaquinone biosynthesis C-methylase UbiE